MKNNFYKKCAFAGVLVIILLIVIVIILRYNVEGEKDMPYKINKILLVSTASGKPVDDANNIWNINISEVNDVYLFFEKSKETDQTIKEIRFENFVINTKPKKGDLSLLRPTGELKSLYSQSTGNYLDEGITYVGGVIDDMKALEISNTGGMVGFRFSLDNLGSYISNDSEEINYDGSLLTNIGINLEDIKYNVSFDVIIKTSKDVSYKGTINMDMPVDNVLTEKDSNKEITDFSDVIFKRI